MAKCEILHDRLKKKLMVNENGDNHSAVSPRNKRAAVLICLFNGKDGELHVILTRRSMKLSSHPGMYIFFEYCMKILSHHLLLHRAEGEKLIQYYIKFKGICLKSMHRLV